MLHIFEKGNQLGALFIFNILWGGMKHFMKNVSSTELHFLVHKPEQLHAECHFLILNCLCWFLFQVLTDCDVNRHKHEINFFCLEVMLWLYEWIRWGFGLIKVRLLKTWGLCISSPALGVTGGQQRYATKHHHNNLHLYY